MASPHRVGGGQIFLSIYAALILKTETPVPGSVESVIIDLLLSSSSLGVIGITIATLGMCVKSKMPMLHKVGTKVGCCKAEQGDDAKDEEKVPADAILPTNGAASGQGAEAKQAEAKQGNPLASSSDAVKIEVR